MILGSGALRREIELEQIVIMRGDKTLTPEEIQIEPASIDLTLGEGFLEPLPNQIAGHGVCTTIASRPVQYKELTGNCLWIPAHGFMLARTAEYIRMPQHLTAFVEGRSSVGRLGLFVQNAGWVDPGFHGTITLELFNALPNPIAIPVGTRICQIVVAEAREVLTPYRGKYQGQVSTWGTELHRDIL